LFLMMGEDLLLSCIIANLYDLLFWT